MPKFQFTISREVTESALVTVTAPTLQAAQAIALAPEFVENPSNATFIVDDGNDPNEHYLPDPDDFEEID